MLKMLPLKLKAVLILSLLFGAMLLPAFTCPWNQNGQQSSSNPTPTPTVQTLSDWINSLSSIRQTTYGAIKQIQGLDDLHRLPWRYYLNATDYYQSTLAPSFNNWLGNLIQEVKNDQSDIGTSSEDIQQENAAFAQNEGFIQWAQNLNTIYGQQGVIPGTHQGGYLAAMQPMGEDPPIVEDFIKSAWESLKEFGKNTGEDIAKYAIQQAYQQITLEDQLYAAMWGTWQDALNSAG